MQLTLAIDEYVVFDFETTGLSPWSGDEIVEVGAMKIFGNDLDEENVFHTLINPGRPISPDASAVNGITNEMVAQSPRPLEVIPRFLDFVGSARLVAQNAKFDMGFLMKYLMQLNLKKELRVYDTIAFSKRAFPRENRHNLDVISQRLKLAHTPSERHRSLGDVKLTARAFLCLREMLGSGSPSPERYGV